MESILEHKALVICKIMAANGWIQPEPSGQFTTAYSMVLEALKNGGDYKLLEIGTTITAKTRVRDGKGRVIGEQG